MLGYMTSASMSQRNTSTVGIPNLYKHQTGGGGHEQKLEERGGGTQECMQACPRTESCRAELLAVLHRHQRSLRLCPPLVF